MTHEGIQICQPESAVRVWCVLSRCPAIQKFHADPEQGRGGIDAQRIYEPVCDSHWAIAGRIPELRQTRENRGGRYRRFFGAHVLWLFHDAMLSIYVRRK